MANGRLVILSGPSGVGKDTVIEAWAKKNHKVKRVVAYTTRPPRVGETEGVDYHFVSADRFHELADAGAFLEYKCVHGNFYATPLKDMESMLSEGLIAILKIDVQGALTAMEQRPDALSVFLLPPSAEVLESRIRGRNSDTPEAIEKRLGEARNEMLLADRYHYRVVNDDLKSVVAELESILTAAVA